MNKMVISLLEELADLSALNEEKQRTFAYRRAARTIEELNKDARDVTLTSLDGIGTKINCKIQEMFKCGTCERLEKLRKKVGHLYPLLQISGVGPVTARKLNHMYGATCKEDVVKLIEEGKVTNKSIIEGVQRKDSERLPYEKARTLADMLIDKLKEQVSNVISHIEACGSLRRKQETIGDIDIIVETDDFARLAIASKPLLDAQVADGKDIITGVVEGTHVDFRFATKENMGAMMLYFTGNTKFNIEMRKEAMRRGWTLNEYGLWKGKERLAGSTEQEIFDTLGFVYVEPEERQATNLEKKEQM